MLPLVAITPLLAPGLPASHDGPQHIYRAVELTHLLRQGEFYPRWAPDLAQGLGYPIFNFYPPLTYYLLAGFNLAGLPMGDAVKVALALGFLACGFGMYLFARDLIGRTGALFAAAAYVYAPFHLTDAYIRLDLAEFLAIAYFPPVLWSFRRLVLSPSRRRLALAAALYAGLALTHNLMALFFSALLGAYVLLLVVPRRSLPATLQAGGAVALGLALSAFYWLPALFEKSIVQLERAVQPPFFDFHAHFVPFWELIAIQQPADSRLANPELVPRQIGASLLVLALIGIFALWQNRADDNHRAELWFFAGVTAVSAFLMTDSSAIIWETLPLVAFAQFPWRMLALANLAVAILAGAGAGAIIDGVGRAGGGFPRVQALLSLLLAAFVILPSVVALVPARRDLNHYDPTVADALKFERDSTTLGTTSSGEYLPIEVEEILNPSPMLAHYEGTAPLEWLNRSMLPPETEAELLHHGALRESHRLTSATPTTLLFNVHYYPSWRAFVDGEETAVTAFEPNGLITLTVPAGSREVELRWQDTPLATLANLLSLGALAILIGAAAVPVARKQQRYAKRATPDRGRPSLVPALVLAALLPAFFVAKVGYVDDHSDWFRATSPEGAVLGCENPLSIDFGTELRLLCYDVASRELKAGDALSLRLYWEALRPPEADYSVFVHLVTEPGAEPVAQQDSLSPGQLPTTDWDLQTYVADEYQVELPAELPSGRYELVAGLYDREAGGARLPVEDGAPDSADHVTLGTVQVRQ